MSVITLTHMHGGMHRRAWECPEPLFSEHEAYCTLQTCRSRTLKARACREETQWSAWTRPVCLPPLTWMIIRTELIPARPEGLKQAGACMHACACVGLLWRTAVVDSCHASQHNRTAHVWSQN